MSRETKDAKRTRALAVIEALDAAMPEAKIELDYQNPLQLLVAVILSAQCTDKRVNMVTPALFDRFRSAADYGNAEVGEVEGFIKTCGLYKSKARNLVAAGKALADQHGGEVPLTRSVLEELPGVGKKTAGVVSIHLGGTEAFPVDTHILRLSVRLGLSRATEPDKVEADLQALFPRQWWTKGHQLLIWHGRRTCYARSPECDRCVVNSLCPKIGVKKAKSAPPATGRGAVPSPPRVRRGGASSAS